MRRCPPPSAAIVATVDSIMNVLTVSVTIITPRPAVSTRKMPAHSQVAPWKNRCSPGCWAGWRSATTSAASLATMGLRAAGGPGEQDEHDQVAERELEQEDPQLAGGQDHHGLQGEHDG